MDDTFELYKELGEIIDQDLSDKQIRNRLIDMQDQLRGKLIDENVCPHCGGQLVNNQVPLPSGEPPEYITVCSECGYEVEE